MSLLLQALQKSQAESSQPALLTHHSAAQQPISPQGGNTIIHTASGGVGSPWLALLLGCNLMLLIVAGFVWLDWRQNQQQTQANQLLVQALTRELSAPKQSSSPRLTEQIPELGQSTASHEILPQPEPKVVWLDAAARPPEPAAGQPQSQLAQLDKSKMYQPSELPQELRTEFPQLNYNAHLYSPDLPSARMFMANDKRYGEQDQIDDNTKVEAIVPEGVIFNFKGLRVKVDVVDELQ